jgi:hypothetical protein
MAAGHQPRRWPGSGLLLWLRLSRRLLTLLVLRLRWLILRRGRVGRTSRQRRLIWPARWHSRGGDVRASDPSSWHCVGHPLTAGCDDLWIDRRQRHARSRRLLHSLQDWADAIDLETVAIAHGPLNEPSLLARRPDPSAGREILGLRRQSHQRCWQSKGDGRDSEVLAHDVVSSPVVADSLAPDERPACEPRHRMTGIVEAAVAEVGDILAGGRLRLASAASARHSGVGFDHWAGP